MTLEMIETFLVLNNTKSFSRTAEMLFVSQSTITNRIKQLEQELNCVLFDRLAKTVEITDAGMHFLQYAQEISSLSQESVENLRSYQSFDKRISVCTTDSIWRYFLLSFFSEYVPSNPNIAFKFYTQDSRETAQLVIAGRMDMGVTLLDVFHPEVERITLFKDPFYLVAAKGLVPEGTVISKDNIRNYSYIHGNWSADFNKWYDRNYRYRNYHLEIGHTTHIAHWVHSGRGMAFFPRGAVIPWLESGELVSIPFEQGDNLPLYTGYLVYMKRNRQKLSDLIDQIILHVNSIGSSK